MWKDNSEHFYAIQKSNLTCRVLERFIEYGDIFINEIKNKLCVRELSFRRYLSYCLGGATFMMVNGWFLDGMKNPIGELGVILSKIYQIIIKESEFYNINTEIQDLIGKGTGLIL